MDVDIAAQSADQAQEAGISVGKKIKQRFYLSLIAIGLSLTVIFAGLALFIQQQAYSTNRIQLTMQQRELSGQINQLTEQLVATNNVAKRKNILQAISQTAANLEKTHTQIIAHTTGMAGMSAKEKTIYLSAPNKLNQRLKDFLAAVTRLESEQIDSINADTSAVEVIITEGPGHLLQSLNNAVAAHISSVSESLRYLLFTIGALWALIIAVLLAQGFFIFRPVYSTIAGTVASLLHGAQKSSDDHKLEEEMRKFFKDEAMAQKTILNHIDKVIIATDPNGMVKSFNQFAEKLLGYASSEVLGKKTADFFHDAQDLLLRSKQLSIELERDIKAGFETLIAKACSSDYERAIWSLRNKSGDLVTVNFNYRIIRNQDDEISGYLAVGVPASVQE